MVLPGCRPFTGDEHLCGGCRLGEGILAVHVAHEIFAEGDKEKNTQHTSQQGTDKDLCKGDGDFFRIGFLENIECRKGEDGTCHDDARAGTDRLDNDVFAQCVFAFGGTRYADGNDGDGDGGFEYLPHLQPQIGGCGRKEDGHQNTPCHRPGIYF